MLGLRKLFKMKLMPSKMLRRRLPWKVWQNAGPQDVQRLIPRACEYVMPHGKRESADMIKLDLETQR